MNTGRGRDLVAVILAVGTALALNVFVAAVLYTAIWGQSDVRGGISENGTQVITGAFGGIIGVLGSYLGFRAGASAANGRPQPPDDPELAGQDRPVSSARPTDRTA